jgi:hypothetical protein
MGWRAALVRPGGKVLLDTGRLKNEIVVACRKRGDYTPMVRKLRSGAEKELDEAYRRGRVGSCGVSVSMGGEDPGDYNPLGEEIVSRMNASRATVRIETTTGRSRISLKLQDAVWKAVGRMAAGMLEDPQTGEFWIVSGRGKKKVFKVEARDEEEDELRGLKEIYSTARARGLPADKAGLKYGGMSTGQMEEILGITARVFRGRDEAEDLMGLFLEDFAAARGRKFVEANRAWWERIRRKYGVEPEV